MTDVNLAVLNRSVMRELIGDDDALAKQFETEFLKQAKLSLNKIVGFFNKDEFKEIKEEAHFLKTSAKAIGAELTADLLQQLEQASLDANKANCKIIIVKVSDSVKQVYGEITNGS